MKNSDKSSVRRQKSDLTFGTNWQPIQDSLSSLTNLTIETCDIYGNPIGIASNENPLCRLIRSSPKGKSLCQEHCGKNQARASGWEEPITFECFANLLTFASPVTVGDDQKFVILAGHSLTDPPDPAVYRKIAEMAELDPSVVLKTVRSLKVKERERLKQACRFITTISRFLMQNAFFKDKFKHQVSQLMTLFDICTDLTFSVSEKEIYSVVLNTLGILFDINSASIMLKDKSQDKFTTRSVFGEFGKSLKELEYSVSHDIIQLLLDKKQPILLRGSVDIQQAGVTEEVSSVHLFPLIKRNEIEGIVIICNTPLIEDDVRIINSFCGQVSIAMESAFLREELFRHQQDFSFLAETSQLVGSVLDSHQLFRLILERSTQLLQAEQGSIMLFSERDLALSIKAIKGLNEKVVEQFRIRPGEGIAGKVIKTGKPIKVDNIEEDQRIMKRNRPRYRTKSFISLPLKVGGRAIGILNLADKITGEIFSDEDLEILETYASHAVVAIERARFYEQSKALKMISITDSLTGLLNRRYFQERFSEEFDRTRRQGHHLSLIMIDIDNFKAFNDANGHLAGDEALQSVANCIRNSVRTMDVVSRYGGEEFSVILPETSKNNAAIIAERVRKDIEITYFQNEEALPDGKMTISLGLATFPDDAGSVRELINNADQALYKAKNAGKNRVILFDQEASSQDLSSVS